MSGINLGSIHGDTLAGQGILSYFGESIVLFVSVFLVSVAWHIGI